MFLEVSPDIDGGLQDHKENECRNRRSEHRHEEPAGQDRHVQHDHAGVGLPHLLRRRDGEVFAFAQKVGEEAIELVIEAKDDNEDLFKNEAADLLYHYLILLRAKSLKLEEIEQVLSARSIKKN